MDVSDWSFSFTYQLVGLCDVLKASLSFRYHLDVSAKPQGDHSQAALSHGCTSWRGGSRAVATSKMECFVIIVSNFQSLTIITNRSILDVAGILDSPLNIVMTHQHGPQIPEIYATKMRRRIPGGKWLDRFENVFQKYC